MSDDDLLADLRAMWRATDPPPPDLVDDVLLRLAPELDDDPELLALLADSDVLDGVRAGGSGDTRTFAGDGIDLLLSIGRTPDGRRRIDGWIAPAARGAVTLAVGAFTGEAAVGDTGRFVLTAVPVGDAVLEITVRIAGAVRRLRTPAFPL